MESLLGDDLAILGAKLIRTMELHDPHAEKLAREEYGRYTQVTRTQLLNVDAQGFAIQLRQAN